MAKVYTHGGQFHSDDCFCVALLLTAGLIKSVAEVARVFKLPEVLEDDTFIIDIGGKYDGERFFDHHQKDAPTHYLGHKMAAFGQLWQLYGIKACDGDQEVAARVYDTLVQQIDMLDNGQSMSTPINKEWHQDSLASIISGFNAPFGAPPADVQVAFEAAVNLARTILAQKIARAQEWANDRTTVYFARREAGYLVLEKGGQWQEHVLSEATLAGIFYVIYPSDRGGYLLQCVPDAPGSFGQRKSLPSAWKGLRGDALAAATGLPLGNASSVFCHPAGFIAGAETLEMVEAMARIATQA